MFFWFVDHPIHQPHAKENPWAYYKPPTKDYTLNLVSGVFHVYATSDSQTTLFPFPSLETFVADMNQLCTMIADGPL